MSNFSSRVTFRVVLFVFFLIFTMYIMSDVLHIDSYREDHFIPHEEEATYASQNHLEKEDQTLKTHDNDSIIDNEPRLGENDQIELLEPSSDSIMTADDTADSDLVPVSTLTISDEAFFKNLLTEYQTEILNSIPPTTNRKDILIRYYQRVNDNNRINVLEENRFYVHVRPISDSLESESNAIFFGDNVSTNDIQIIAYLLIKEGMPIKSIQPSKFHDGWKANSVEIGHDVSLRSRNRMTLAEVRSFSNSQDQSLE
jgi:hypothetical protein